MKNRSLIIFLIAILAILAISITVGMFWLIGNHGHFGFINFGTSSVSTEKIFEKSYETVFKDITIDTDASDIYIKEASNGEIRIVIYGETKQLELNDDSSLYIKYVSKKCIGFCFNTQKSKIEIYLPSDYDGKFDIENKYGDTEIAEFLNANIDIEANYGNIEIKGINEGKVNNSCGNIEIGTITNAEVENNFGNIKIKKVLSYLDVEADCGDITINEITIDKDSSIKNSMGDIDVGKTNDIKIDAHTSLGDTEVRNNNSTSEILLTIDNSCGNITVKN